MSQRIIEDVIKDTLSGDTQKNALELIAHLRTDKEPGKFSITMYDKNNESGWNVANLGFIIISGSDDFPGPWTMWVGTNKLDKHAEFPVDEHIKEFAWSHVSPCGSCGGKCSPGTSVRIFGKYFENVCQSNLIFVNPDANTVDYMKKIIDIIKEG